MTEDEKEMAVTMLESGCSYSQVARNLGKHRTTIWEMFHEQCGEKKKAAEDKKKIRASGCPALCKYLIENDMPVSLFAYACHVSEFNIRRLLKNGIGSKTTIEQVCKVTGIPEKELLGK